MEASAPDRPYEPSGMEPAMRLALEASFGSIGRWRDEFVACAGAPGDGVRGVRLVFLAGEGRLVHRRPGDDGAGAGVTLLSLERRAPGGDADADADADAGAGAAAGDGAEAFVDGIDWPAVHARYQGAVYAASESCAADPDEVAGALLLDVRRAGAYAQATTVIPGARWADPATVADWGADLPAARAVVVYCVHGHEVSRAVALRLRAAGLDARYLRGGIAGWQAAGRALQDQPAGAQR